MLLRLALFIVLGIFVARAFWRLVDGIVAGIAGPRRQARGGVPARGVAMVRDPVCGTFLLPDSALTLVDGRARLFFCSETCRDAYRPSTGSGPGSEGRTRAGTGGAERVHGRTA